MLWCLWQSIELAWCQNCWNNIISCPFWRRRCKNWCLNLNKSHIRHFVSNKSQNFSTLDYSVVKCSVSQVQITIFETKFFFCVWCIVNFKRKNRIAFAQNPDFFAINFNISCFHFWIFAFTFNHSSKNRNNSFFVYAFKHFVIANKHLCDAIVVAKCQKCYSAKFSYCVNPTSKSNLFSRIIKSEFCASFVSINIFFYHLLPLI